MTFRRVKTPRYFALEPTPVREYSAKVISEASEAIIVPVPPMLTPRSSSLKSDVNCESNIALGTLDISWHDKVENMSVFFWSRREKRSRTVSIFDIFPAKMKNIRKVPSKK